MPSCLYDLVSLGLCDDETSESGLTLMQAPGMSPLNGEKIATEQYGTGKAMFEAKKSVAVIMIRNDFLRVMQANNIVSTITKRPYDTAYFDTAESTSVYDGYRGQVLTGVKTGNRAGLRKLKISGFQCYPLQSGDGQIIIKDYSNGVEVETVVDVEFVANQLNTFSYDYTATHSKIMVLTNQSEFTFAKSVITCKTGCNGVNNPCGYAQGYNGAELVKSDGFGLNVIFNCDCDYDSLMCNFSQPFMGQLLWLKWQELVYEEMYKSNRFNAWTIYNREDIWNNILPDIRERYTTEFNGMIQSGSFAMLGQYNDNDCLNCRGIKVMTNI